MRDLNALVLSSELREVEARLANFNLFRVLRFEHGEIRHSNVLSWLFQPDETHGLKDSFLRRWLMRVHHDAPEALNAAVEVDALGIRSVRVVREWRTGSGALDLLIRIQTFDEGEWVIAIENKVWSEQSAGQLKRYRDAVERAFPTAKCRVFIFLSRLDRWPEDKAWLRASYKQVREELKTLLNEQKDLIGPEPAVLIRHYLEILEEVSMSQDRIAQLAKTLYQNHRLALEAIMEHRPDYIRDISEHIAEQMRKDAQTQKLTALLCQKYYIRFLPSEWDMPANREGQAWGKEESAYVLCEIWVDDEYAPVFGIVQSSGPEKWCDELWEMAKEKKFRRIQERVRKPKQWMKVYSVQADFDIGEQAASDSLKAATKVWEWVKEEMKTEDFKKALKAITEHIKKLPEPVKKSDKEKLNSASSRLNVKLPG